MAKVFGFTQGLKTSQIRRLDNLYRRKLPPAQLILPEQALALARLSAELGRQIGLVASRRGEVVSVMVGGPEDLPPPDLARLRRGRTRLAGYYLVHTRLGPGGLSPWDFTELVRRRWDLVAVLGVEQEGLPGLMQAAHLLPQPVDGQDYRRLPAFAPGQPPEDFERLVRSLEEELARLSPPQALGKDGAAILLSVTTGPRAEAEERLDELAELARSAGLEPRERVIQRRQRLDPRTLLGPGKLAEVLALAFRAGAQVLLFDQELSPSQAHALALATSSDLKVLDRTQLILDIFAQRAKSSEGKLQVEMAQMRYLMPRLSMRDDGLSRLTGGIGGRGPGETRLEIDRRRVRERLHRLERELGQMGRQRARRRGRRQSLGLPIISIVGYTNAGKSTLLNALTNSEVAAEDRLFATLDPTSRRLRFPKEREVIITDTVGFIRDLPAELKLAFAATLEELDQADLLLHLADAANPQVEAQIEAVDNLLDELGLTQTPRLLVLNKMDLAPFDRRVKLTRRHHAVAISALDARTLPSLLTRLEEMVEGLASPRPDDPASGA
ncbi:MAG: GTPase HflX [Desulfarculus sp.]|nr:GTPase HflX [Desulfarculus sp.]